MAEEELEKEVEDTEDIEEEEPQKVEQWGSLKLLDAYRERKTCMGCTEQRKGYAYWRNSGITGRFARFKTYTVGPLCKKCTAKFYKILLEEDPEHDEIKTMMKLCYINDIYFDHALLKQLIMEGKNRNFPDSYFEIVCDKLNEDYTGLSFDQQMEYLLIDKYTQFREDEMKLTKEDLENRKDIIATFLYDPFEKEPIERRPSLYRDLSQMIDESMKNDLVRQKAAITVVKSFEQMSRFDEALAQLTVSPESITEHAAEIESLNELRTEQQRIVTNFCKDHGFSSKYANAKSKGAGTLSGAMREMTEENYDDAITNYYDIATSSSIQHIADISVASIVKQLNLSEQDYLLAMREQADYLRKVEKELADTKEALRLMRAKEIKGRLLDELEQEYRDKGLSPEEIKELMEREYTVPEHIEEGSE